MDLLSSTDVGAHQALTMAESLLASPKVEPSPRHHNTQPAGPIPLDLPAAASNPVSPTHSTSRSSASSHVSDQISSSSSTPTHSHSQTLHSASSRRALSPTSVSSLSSSPSSPSPLSPTSSSAGSYSSGSSLADDHCVLFLGDLGRGVSESEVGALFGGYGDVVGDLDGTVTSADLRAAFAVFGPLIDEETFVKANNGKYGFVRFQTRSDAERAKQQMNRKTLGSRAVRIGWGDNNIQKHCVHVQFMPHSTAAVNSGSGMAAAQPPLHLLINESVVHKEFRRFGNIVSVSLPRTAEMRLKGFAFVHFGESEAGEQSAAAAVSTMADGQINGVPVRVSYGKRQVVPRYRGRSVSGSSSGLAAVGGLLKGRSRSGDEGMRDERGAPVYAPPPVYSPALPPSSPPFNSFGYASPPIHSRVPSSPLASPLAVPMYPNAYYSLNQPLYLLTPSSSPAAYYPTGGPNEPIPLQLGEDGSVGWYAAAGGGAGGSVSMRDQLVYQMAAMQQQQQQQQQQLYLARQQQQQRQQRQPQSQMQQAPVDGDQQPMTSSGVG